MRNKRLGCLTGTGIISTLVTALAIAGFGFAQGGSMFNAGALNAQTKAGVVLGNVSSHAEIGNNCGACHTAPWDASAMADRCVICHSDIADQMKQVATLHGLLANKGSDVLACYDCHPEHRGATASLVDMSGQQFPHDALGFSLKEHQRNFNLAPLTCQDCHGSDIKTFDQTTCQNCHGQHDASFMQSHVIAYGANCLGCHTGANRFGEGFNHNSFAFKLDGKHASVKCDQCHAGAQKLTDFVSAPKDCFSCHKQNDPHAGQFGTDCSGCHSPAAWNQVTFDHSKSNFPLTGAHANVACQQCHANGQFKGLSTTCVSCHAEPAVHAGQFGTDCASCHSTTAWSPATFNGQQHTFPLNHGERGGTVSCVTCHPNNFTTYTCYGCHEHNQQEIASKHLEEGISNFSNCVQCHPTGREHD